MAEEFYKKNSSRPEGLFPGVLGIVHHMLMTSPSEEDR
jgi:hypothetical protein